MHKRGTEGCEMGARPLQLSAANLPLCLCLIDSVGGNLVRAMEGEGECSQYFSMETLSIFTLGKLEFFFRQYPGRQFN